MKSHSIKQMIAKTLLASLESFGKYLVALDKSIVRKAQNSYIDYHFTYAQVLHICKLIDDNCLLREIKTRIETLLTRAPAKYEKVIYLFYHHDLPTLRIAEILKVSQRTVFRYLASALDWFTTRIDEVIDPIAFAQLIQNQSWLRSIYNRIK